MTRNLADAVDAVDEAVRARPATALRPYVAWYSGYRQRGIAPAVHRGLPSPYLTFILTLDEPLTVAEHPDPAQPGDDYATLLGGLHTRPALITHDGRQSGVQIAVHPLAARALFGLPAGELAGLDVPAEAVLGAAGRRLQERLREAGDWPARFAALDDALLRAARPSGRVPAEVLWAWQALLRSGGGLPVAALARETGWSGRHLQGRFRRETGLAPKAAARVIRFDRARRLLGAPGPVPRLAELAVRCGYFDQAHLAREFRALAGCAPSVWLAAEGADAAKFRNVQGGAGVPAPEWEP
ncbi:helix-turn-helix domain-containing protein [Kitasatospora sp. A2-31]|uniref:helix-turn-helix domain-containing protein n=1 Tax=Kitasatospora sp. A2-31 TaxID=2916414 RepID=UPI001EEA44F8|nr:helix-turn-helix domain-containing protein [Kitasatospora sp. A2-31]MCG6497946.1 helix-turn-helix domain-containing protein [Kitasatospora sp. A2-31]